MMKKISLFITSLLLLSGCIQDERDNFMVPDSFGITSLEKVVEASVHPGTYVLGIAKSGKGQTAASVRINRKESDCQAVLNTYNKEHQTAYKLLPASLVTLDATEFDFPADEAARQVTLSWDPEQVAARLGDGESYVIPILLESSDATVKVQQDRSYLLVHLNRSGVEVSQTLLTRVVEKKTVEPDKSGVQPPLQESIVLDVVIDNPIKGMAITYPVITDNSLIEPYNREQGKDYMAAPDGLVTIETPVAPLPEGGKSCTVKLTVDYRVLLKDGVLPQFPSYLVPIRLKTEAMTATLNGKDFTLKGLSYGNVVTYIAFEWKESKQGFNVVREWGRYSTATAAWSDYLPGFTANSDRNVTLDGDYIYIAETNSSKNLWAISLKDAATFKKLPVGTVIDNGTFHLSCPRVIPNSDAAINGGKPVLAVSSMHTGGDPVLYFYDKGIEADPSKVTMTTWASRRLGDTFSWWGTLQNGVLFFKDFASVQGTVTFWMRGKVTGTLYLVGRIAAPPVTGAGAYFPFPDNINIGFGSTRGGTQSYLVQSSKDLATFEGADNNPTIMNLDNTWNDCSFRFFELAGKRYIAVAKQDNSAAGRLIILEGEQTAAWQNILSSGKTVYVAAIQNGTENEELDTTGSPKISGNSGMDLDIYQHETDVYIAVVKQNVGLSLFHVSNDE